MKLNFEVKATFNSTEIRAIACEAVSKQLNEKFPGMNFKPEQFTASCSYGYLSDLSVTFTPDEEEAVPDVPQVPIPAEPTAAAAHSADEMVF